MIERDPAPQGPIVTGFSGAGFKVGGGIFPTGLLLTPEHAHSWEAPRFEDLTEEAIAPLLALNPRAEFLLIGTGATMRRPAADFVQALEKRDIGIEAMDSRAAARAWGILRGEGRWIVAALLPL